MSGRIREAVAKMRGYTPGEQSELPGVIKLNTNENPYPPSQHVTKALADLNVPALRLYPNPVCRELRWKIAEMHKCAEEQIVVGNGGDELLGLCTRTFVEDNGTIGYLSPSYSLYPVLAAIRGVQGVPIELGENYEWQIPRGYAASLFFLCNPNAPSGTLYPKETVQAFCQSFAGVVLIDEAYVDFASADCMELATTMENVLVLRSLSKAYSLAGVRVGYAVGHASLIEALFKVKDSYNVNRISQAVALAALEDQPYKHQNLAKIKETRHRMQWELETLGFQVLASEANFVWARPSKVDAKTLHMELYKKNMLIRYFPGPRTGDFVRISVGLDRVVDSLMKAIQTIQG